MGCRCELSGRRTVDVLPPCRERCRSRLHGSARLCGLASKHSSGREDRMVKPRAAISWSGGKDCCTALLRTHRQFDLVATLTMFSEDGERSRSHGLRPDIIAAHAQLLGVTSLTGRCSWTTYTDEYVRM